LLGEVREVLAPREWTVEQLRERLQLVYKSGSDSSLPFAVGLAKVLLFGAAPLTSAAVLSLKWDDPKLFSSAKIIGDPPLSLRNGSLLVVRNNAKATIVVAATSATETAGKGKALSSLARHRQAALTAARSGSADSIFEKESFASKAPRVHAEPSLRIHVYQPVAGAIATAESVLPHDESEEVPLTEEIKVDNGLAEHKFLS
jgi:hypothetical protein